MTKEEALQACTVEGMVVKLPKEDLGKTYGEVKKALEKIGGKWKGGKTFGFVFEQDPTELLADIAGGANRNLKKEFQFYGTPAALCDRLVQLAEIGNGMSVLEPSAGQGAIIEAIYRALPHVMKSANDRPSVTVDYYELMPLNIEKLSAKVNANEVWSSRTSCMGLDFLKDQRHLYYDRIVANPPFAKNQDIQHIYKMHHILKKGGIMVSIASKHWQFSDNNVETVFRKWLISNRATIIDLDAGEFKESGTNIQSCIIVIKK